MRSDVLQASALCYYGNAYLSGATGEAPELRSSHSTFKQVYDLAFHRTGGLTYDAAPEATAQWFKRLKDEGVERLRLNLEQCSRDAARQGSDDWGIIVDGDRGCEIWKPEWKRRSWDTTDATPYRVTYTGRRYSRWSLLSPVDTETAHEKMGKALSLAGQFAFSQHMTQISPVFERCVGLHAARSCDMLGVPDLCPEGFPKAGLALVASVLRIQLVLNSNYWAVNDTDPPIQATFAVNSLRLWHAGMLCLESAATMDLHEQAPPMDRAVPRSEAS